MKHKSTRLNAHSAIIVAIALTTITFNSVATCPDISAIVAKTTKNCPPAPETSGGCIVSSWFDNLGNPFQFSCAYEPGCQCLLTSWTKIPVTQKDQYEICDIFGTGCGAVYSTDSNYIGM